MSKTDKNKIRKLQAEAKRLRALRRRDPVDGHWLVGVLLALAFAALLVVQW